MSKGKVIKYEFKRLLLSKGYLLLLAATLAYCVALLQSIVMFGVDFTAPFSQWTFSAYCSSLTPFLYSLLLLLCARQLNPSERKAEAIINATPTQLQVVQIMRYGAIAGAFLIAVIVPIISCFMFYRVVFDYTDVGILFLLGMLQLLAPAILLFGIVMLVGRQKATAAYIMLAIILTISIFQIPIPAVFDFSRDATVYDNLLTPAFIVQQVVCATVGVVCIVISIYLSMKKPRID